MTCARDALPVPERRFGQDPQRGLDVEGPGPARAAAAQAAAGGEAVRAASDCGGRERLCAAADG